MNNDRYFLGIAQQVASNSKCLSRKLGAVIVKDQKFIVSTGYNGPPSGCLHCYNEKHRQYIFKMHAQGGKKGDKNHSICPRKEMGFESGDGLEYCQAAHAERNAIAIAAKLGHSTDGYSMYLDWEIPCVECSKSIINAGIKEVVVVKLENYDKKGITGRYLLEQAGVKVREYHL